MLIEQALMTYLLAQTGITDLVSTRLYFMHAPQEVITPYLVLFKVDSPGQHSHDGADGLGRPRFQVSIFSTGYGNAHTIAAAVRAALDGYQGTMGGEGGVYVNSCLYDNEQDLYELDTKLYHVAQDYLFWHDE